VKLPVYTWLQGYDRGWIRGDVIAGLTVWAVLVPEALAYATIAGVSPVVGLYAAPGALPSMRLLAARVNSSSGRWRRRRRSPLLPSAISPPRTRTCSSS
jgi:MFS superfamily sulfate permease-like transporter